MDEVGGKGGVPGVGFGQSFGGGVAEGAGVQGVAEVEEACGEGVGPAGFDEFQVSGGAVGAVEFVAEKGVAGVVQVHADLMHATGNRMGFNERKGISPAGGMGKGGVEALEHVAVGEAGSAVGMHGLHEVDGAFGELSAAAQGGVDAKFLFVGPAVDEGVVNLGELPAHHGFAEGAGGVAVFGDKHETARFAVEPVDDGELGAVDNFVGQQVVQAIQQGGRAAGLGGVDLQARGFVDDDVVIGFVDDAKIGRKRTPPGLRGPLENGGSGFQT